MRHLYTIVFTLALPLVFLKLWRKGKTLPIYRKRWRERLGYNCYEKKSCSPIWVHTVSVGEFLAARPVISHLLNTQQRPVVVTTMTPSGSEQVTNTFGDKVFHCYLPYDIPALLNRFFNAIDPSCLIVMETELWPNLIHNCYIRKIPSIIINARLSEKSQKGYQKFFPLTQQMLKKITHIAVQNTEDGERFKALGLPAQSMTITGNIKFDFNLNEELITKAQTLRDQYNQRGGRQVIIAGSTHSGEDELILESFSLIKQQNKHCLLVLAPRHPERTEAIQKQCTALGFETLLRSSKITPQMDTDVLLGDTMGELVLLYGTADIAIVCGSFANIGGHNYIEPASLGIPIISGPQTFNFAKVAKLLKERNALDIAKDAESLAKICLHLLSNPVIREEKGKAAKEVAEENKGALKKLLSVLDQFI